MKPGPVVYIDGRWCSRERACVPVDDRGFLYGDGLFETLRAYRGVPFGLREHLDRMTSSAHFLGLALPRTDWDRVLGQLLARNRLTRTDAWVRVIVTRGSGGAGPQPPRRARPRVVAMAGRVGAAVRKRQREGVRLITVPLTRGLLAAHKSLNYLEAVVGRAQAQRRGADDALFTDASGRLLEATAASLFVVRGGRLLTPKCGGILPGITRSRVLALAAAAGIPAAERTVSAASRSHWSEAFLASSVAEIVPVIAVDGEPVGSGAPGPVTRRLQALYREAALRGTAPSAAAAAR